jgi:hypothetical protein
MRSADTIQVFSSKSISFGEAPSSAVLAAVSIAISSADSLDEAVEN